MTYVETLFARLKIARARFESASSLLRGITRTNTVAPNSYRAPFIRAEHSIATSQLTAVIAECEGLP